MRNIEIAKRRWKNLLGKSLVEFDAVKLAAHMESTFPTSVSIAGVLMPRTSDQVRECVRIASKFRVPLYPVSRGKNWGYGTALPVKSGCVLLRLEKMNRILEYNAKLGYVVIEPGVTFRQLSEYLIKKKSKFMANYTAVPYGSIIGNLLENGLGNSKNGDESIDAILSIEAVLADGSVVRTGMARYPGSKSKQIYRRGVGPRIDGLFIQSNLGVVTRITLGLHAKPRCCELGIFQADSNSTLSVLVERLRELRLTDQLRGRIYIGNDFIKLMKEQKYPRDLANSNSPFPTELRARLRSKYGFSLWNGQTIYTAPTAEIARAEMAPLENMLKRHSSRFDVYAQKTLKKMKDPSAKTLLRDLKRTPHMGFPSSSSLSEMYWRSQGPIPKEFDPARDQCGVIWNVPVIPMTGADVVKYADLCERAMKKFRLEIGIGLQFSSVGPTIKAITRIPFDLTSKDECERAQRCFDYLFKNSVKLGYYPYRLGINSMNLLPKSQGSYSEIIRTLRRELDPHGIIAPGRYELD